MFDLLDYEEVINRLLARYGVKFGLYKNGEFIARYLYDKENSDSVYSNPYIQVRQKKSIQNLPRCDLCESGVDERRISWAEKTSFY